MARNNKYPQDQQNFGKHQSNRNNDSNMDYERSDFENVDGEKFGKADSRGVHGSAQESYGQSNYGRTDKAGKNSRRDYSKRYGRNDVHGEVNDQGKHRQGVNINDDSANRPSRDTSADNK